MGKEKTPLATIHKNKIIIAFHQSYFHALFGVALHLTQNENDAQELIAMTFAKICKWDLERLERIEGWDKPAIYVYLSNTLANTHIDWQRKKNNLRKLENKYCQRRGQRFEHSPESIFLADENVRIIKKAYYDTLAKESKIVRVAFYLRTERGLRNKKIADMMDKSPNTIGTHFRKIRLKIREKII